MVAVRILGGLFVLLVWSMPSAQAVELPDPAGPDGYQRMIAHLQNAESHVIERLLEHYDAYLATHPHDVQARIGRCRFLQTASCDEEDDVCPYWDRYEACTEALQAELPQHPEVLLYALENQWGDEALETAQRLLQDADSRWSPGQRARIHQSLAFGYQQRGESRLVIDHAKAAMRLDPTLDLSLSCAQALREEGRGEEAVETLSEHLRATDDYWVISQKIRVLSELGAHERAALALSGLVVPDGVSPDHLLYARIWSDVGRVNDAREAFEKAEQSMAWRQADVQRARFEFELRWGDEETATAYYRRLRDGGLSADPFLKKRLQLAASHPLAPWQLRDALGVLDVLLLVLFIGMLAMLLIAPIHYFGLLRARSDPTRIVATRFRLRHAWIALAVLLLSEVPFFYLEGVTVFEQFVAEATDTLFLQTSQEIPESSLALGALLSTSVLFVGLMAVLRPRDRRLFQLASWSLGRTLGWALACLLAVRLFALLWVTAISAAGVDLSTTLLIEQMIRALVTQYGLPVAFGFVVLAVPLLEEVVFRGVLLDAFSRHVGFGWANLAQAMLFAVSHEEWRLFPFYLLFGALCGLLTRRSGSLLASFSFHLANNALAFELLASGGF